MAILVFVESAGRKDKRQFARGGGIIPGAMVGPLQQSLGAVDKNNWKLGKIWRSKVSYMLQKMQSSINLNYPGLCIRFSKAMDDENADILVLRSSLGHTSWDKVAQKQVDARIEHCWVA